MEGGEVEGRATNEWELSKENIQPLKQGRNMAKLSHSLHQQDEDTARAIQEERRGFEEELRSDAGEDPLDPWYRYIQWVEQTYPKGGKDGQVHVLIEKCIKKFKDVKEVQGDQRFLQIWLKYATMSSNPMEVFEFMYKNGVCTQQGGLYEAWSYQLELQASYKAADAVFVKGLRAVTEQEMKERLKMKQKQFQARAVRRARGEEISAAETEEEERSALGQLRGHGRHGKVGSVRVGQAKLGGPGVMAVKQPLKDNNQQKGGFKIFSDENGGGGGSTAAGSAPGGRLPSREDRKENEKKAGTWGQVKGGRAANVPLSQAGQHRAAFTVHQDELQQPAAPLAGQSKALQARREEAAGTVHCPVALFEDPDPTKRPMYCKDKVYQGTTEFSFEELQASRWKKKDKERQEKEQMENKRLELLEMERRLERKMEEFQRMMSQQQQQQQQVPTVAVTRPSLGSDSGTPSSRDNSRKGSSMDDTAALVAACPSGARPALTPSPHGSRAPQLFRFNSQPSPTVNTREAMAEMQQMWSDASQHHQPPPVPQATPFAIYSDENRAPVPSPAPFPIYNDENAVPSTPVAPFTIFSDEAAEPAVVSIKPRLLPRPAPLPSPTPPDTDSDSENRPPAGYQQPALGARPLGGVLAPSEGVAWMPLEEQERLLDEDEERQEEELGLSQPSQEPARPRPAISANQTIALPTEGDFERMAKLSSTPHTGRFAMQEEQDENTCAVDIVYRSAMGPPAVPEVEAAGCLSPIVETSREYYRSSSSSSGCDTLHSKTPGDKSHWGNTVNRTAAQHAASKTTDSTGASLSRTPGHYLGGVSHGVSGYMGDRSSNMTKSGVKVLQDKRELSTPNRPESYEKRLKRAEESPVADDEPTGMFGDMMAEFKQGLMARQEEAHTSLQLSMVDAGARDRTEMEANCTRADLTVAQPTLSILEPAANLTIAPALNLTEAPGLNLTAAPSLDMTAAPALNMTGAPALNMTGPSLNLTAAPALNMTAAPTLNMTGPDLDLTAAQALEVTADMSTDDLAQQTTNLSLEEDIDPFSPSTHAKLLARLPPLSTLHGYLSLPTALPTVRTKALLTLGSDTFYVSECKGEGGFAKVFAATKQDAEDGMNSTISGIDAVLKVQKPANDWEWYVCREVGLRVAPALRQAFMASPRNYNFTNGGIFVSYHQKLGSLLDIVNISKQCGVQKSCIEPMAVYFTIEMLGMVEALHKADILHADLKADNFLLQRIPTPDTRAATVHEMFHELAPSLQLIDFGKSIDLRILPKDIMFTKVSKTDGLVCPEMREGRGWREHLDYHGLAATAYLLLFTDYMDIVKVGGKWEAKGSFKRWWQQELWKEFFNEFLNIKENLPDLAAWRVRFQQVFFDKDMARSLEKVKQDVGRAMSNI